MSYDPNLQLLLIRLAVHEREAGGRQHHRAALRRRRRRRLDGRTLSRVRQRPRLSGGGP